jgi:hypothetical protein
MQLEITILLGEVQSAVGSVGMFASEYFGIFIIINI